MVPAPFRIIRRTLACFRFRNVPLWIRKCKCLGFQIILGNRVGVGFWIFLNFGFESSQNVLKMWNFLNFLKSFWKFWKFLKFPEMFLKILKCFEMFWKYSEFFLEFLHFWKFWKYYFFLMFKKLAAFEIFETIVQNGLHPLESACDFAISKVGP